MKKTYPTHAHIAPHGNTTIPIEYIDSIIISSYIEAIKCIAMKSIRADRGEEAYGSSDITQYLVESENAISSKESGYWIIETNIEGDDNTNASYNLVVYKHTVTPGMIFTSYDTSKLCEVYYVKCKRIVPKIIVKPSAFEMFGIELESVVSQFKNRAELNVLENTTK